MEHERIVVQGEGEAKIQNQNPTAARRKAINLAMKSAFEAALTQAAPEPLSLSEQHELLQSLAPRVNDFLIRYRFDEMPSEEVIFITVEAAFSRSAFQEEFRKRGFFSAGEGDGVEPETFFLTIQGIRDVHTYLEITRELNRRLEPALSLVPHEIFGNDLTLKAVYRGDMESLEFSAKQALQEIFCSQPAPMEEMDVSVSRVAPSEAGENGAAAPEEDVAVSGEEPSVQPPTVEDGSSPPSP